MTFIDIVQSLNATNANESLQNQKIYFFCELQVFPASVGLNYACIRAALKDPILRLENRRVNFVAL